MPVFQQNDRSPDTTRIYVWLCRDLDGVEGVVAAPTAAGVLPLMATDETRARGFAPRAAEAARHRGFPAVLVAFDRAEVLMEVPPTAAAHVTFPPAM